MPDNRLTEEKNDFKRNRKKNLWSSIKMQRLLFSNCFLQIPKSLKENFLFPHFKFCRKPCKNLKCSFNHHLPYIIAHTSPPHTQRVTAGARSLMFLLFWEINTAMRVQVLDEDYCISHSSNTIGKGMTPIIIPPALGK